MKVKRYMGKTNQEALAKVKANLGNDAIILSTRKIRQRGLKGLFLKPLIEVVAAVDDSTELSEPNVVKSNINVSNYKFNELERQMDTINKTMDELLVILDNKETAKDKQKDNGLIPTEFTKYFKKLIDKEVQRDIAIELIKDAYNIKLKHDMHPLQSLNSVISTLGIIADNTTKEETNKLLDY